MGIEQSNPKVQSPHLAFLDIFSILSFRKLQIEQGQPDNPTLFIQEYLAIQLNNLPPKDAMQRLDDIQKQALEAQNGNCPYARENESILKQLTIIIDDILER